MSFGEVVCVGMEGGRVEVWNRFAVVGVEGILLEDEDGVDIEGGGREGTETETSPVMVYLLMGEIDVVEKNKLSKRKKVGGKKNERLVLWFKYGSCCCTEQQ